MESASLRRSMRLSVGDGALATVMGSLTGGVFLTGFALALGASSLQVGVLAAIPAFANIAQIIGSFLIEHWGHRKAICLWSSTFARLLWLAIVAVGLLGAAQGWSGAVWLMAGLTVVSSMLNSISGVAWLSWTRDLVPESSRIGFFSRRSQMNTMLSLVFGLAGAFFIDAWQRRDASSAAGFAWIFLFAVAMGIGSLCLMAAIPEPTVERGEHKRPRFARLLALPLLDHAFRPLIIFYFCWNLAMNMATPFFVVYMLQNLRLPFWWVTALATLSSVAGMVANGFWTRLSPRFGTRPVVMLATTCDCFVPLLWIFVSPDLLWLLLPIHLAGIFNAPISLGPNNLVLKLAPHRNASPYLAIFSAIVGTTSLAAVFGGGLTEFLANRELSVLGVHLVGLKIVFLISFVGRLTSLLLLRRVREPSAARTRDVVRVLIRARWAPPATGAASRLTSGWVGKLPEPSEPGVARAAVSSAE